MYHGKQGEVPYSSTDTLHDSASERIGEILSKYIGTGQTSQVSKKELVFADFGTCDGVLALDIFKKIFEIPDVGYSHYSVYLNDIPFNDFNLLASKVSDQGIYRRDDVSIMLNVGNMYNRCLPPGSVNIAISIRAVNTLDDVVSDTIFAMSNLVTAGTRCYGGIVVVNFLLDSRYSFYVFMSEEWEVAFKTGLIKKEELQRCLIPVFLRTQEEALEPFKEGVYKDLKLVFTEEYITDFVTQDPDINGVRDMDAFASKVIPSIMSWSRNFFHRSLNKDRSEDEKQNILDEFYKRVRQRIVVSPYEHINVKLFNLAAVKE